MMLVKGMQTQKAKNKNVCEAQTSAAVLFNLWFGGHTSVRLCVCDILYKTASHAFRNCIIKHP